MREGHHEPSSMLTAVMGFPEALWMGMAFTSILDVDTAGRSAPEIEERRFNSSSFLTGAALTAVSFDVDLWGIFRISLYLDCLDILR